MLSEDAGNLCLGGVPAQALSFLEKQNDRPGHLSSLSEARPRVLMGRGLLDGDYLTISGKFTLDFGFQQI
ncbi:hypothetical protein PAPYR_12268 [Paratrimastix pyriformis]|uniref:Uncharacterized protein n=1 Tax=Paratrimastix pyriformis TaxID=342808 RepID=A0ABQ8U3S4_9EUKA|nr:hypothetical protein PAPYR_12268 [Paratrimastix pyriformis]